MTEKIYNYPEYKWSLLPNLGVLQSTLNSEQIKPIWDEVNEIKDQFNLAQTFNSNLAGAIDKEYKLIKSREYIENLISPLCVCYDNHFRFFQKMSLLSENKPLYLESAWVNFQKKYEYNPVHNHSGVFSFVIWLNIPYKQDEKNISPGRKSNDPSAGQFDFIFTNILGEIDSLTVDCDSTKENMILFFPAKLNHCVHPFFNSEEYRITVSGNFKIEV